MRAEREPGSAAGVAVSAHKSTQSTAAPKWRQSGESQAVACSERAQTGHVPTDSTRFPTCFFPGERAHEKAGGFEGSSKHAGCLAGSQKWATGLSIAFSASIASRIPSPRISQRYARVFAGATLHC